MPGYERKHDEPYATLYEQWLDEVYGHSAMWHFWNYALSIDGLQTLLNIGGFFCDYCDLANAAIYAVRLKPAEAGWSVFMAIPLIGTKLGLFKNSKKVIAGFGDLATVTKADDVVTDLYLTYRAEERSAELLSEIGPLTEKMLRDMKYSVGGWGISNGMIFKDLSVAAKILDDAGNVVGVLEIGEVGSKPIIKTQKNIEMPVLPEGSQWESNVLNSFAGGKAIPTTYGGGTVLYRVGGKNGGFWSLDPPPATEYQWRVEFAIKQEFCNDASTLYKMIIPQGSSLSGLEGTVGVQGMGLYGGAHQVYIDFRAVPSDWIEISPISWK